MIEQKDVIQLIGEWGYTPPQFHDKLRELLATANNYSDKIGVVTYMNALSLCNYAISDNLTDSIMMREFVEKDSFLQALDAIMNSESAKSLDLSIEQYCEGVMEAMYERMRGHGSFNEAMIYLRQYTLDSLGPVALERLAKTANEVGKSIMKMIVGMHLAVYEKKEGVAVEYYFNPLAMKAYDKVTEKIMEYRTRILELPSLLNQEFSDLVQFIVDAFYEDMPGCLRGIEIKASDFISMKPHEIYKYRTDYSNIIAVFLVGVSAGIFDYADYDNLISPHKLMEGTLKTDDVERIERTRSN